jgi:anti-sigma factor RsiW
MNELDCAACESALDDLLDDRLVSAERDAVFAHLAGCESCRAIDEQLRWARASLRAVGVGVSDPALAGHLEAVLAAELRATAARRAPDRPADLEAREGSGITRRRMIFVAAAVAAGISGILWLGREATPARSSAFASLKSEFDEHTRSARPGDFEPLDQAMLEARFAGAALPFPARVIDLAMMQIRVVGGSTRAFEGLPATLVLYETPDGPMLCRMILDDTPPSVAPTGRPALRERGFEFVTASFEGVSFVYWREGRVVCVLIARMTEQALLELARAKAMA